MKKIPNTPDVLSAKFTKEELMSVLRSVNSAVIDGKYLHWEDLKYYERFRPEVLSDNEQWWLGLKIVRIRSSKEIQLLDKAGVSFGFAVYDKILEMLHAIDKQAAGQIKSEKPIINQEVRDQYYVSSLIEEAASSCIMEGAASTRKVAAEMIRSNREPVDEGERMIYNNYITMRKMAEFKERPLSKELVFEIHRFIADKTLKPSELGRFRKNNKDEEVFVTDKVENVLHVPPSAEELEERMQKMCDFANGKTSDGFIHPVLRSIILHFWLAYDHPFVDGNGRTARALFYWSMLRHGYWLFEFISISSILLKAPSKYSKSFLYTESDGNDLTYFINYQLEVIDRAIKELHNYIKRKEEQVKEVERLLKESDELNHRQEAILGHGLRHHGFRYTIKSHKESHGVTYQTARTDMLELVDLGLLKKSKSHKKFVFTPSEKLLARARKQKNA